MPRKLPGFIAFICGLLIPFLGHAQLNVWSNYTAQQLAARLAGPGVTVLNPQLTCPSQANGVFETINSTLGLDNGIVLTTGLAASGGIGVVGVNGGAFMHASTRNNAPGDPSLVQLAGQTTHDACALEFDVIPQGDTVKFDYVFGSEEYINATCGPYNDAFAFFISGPGITGTQNMAQVPGTNIPVTINSINSGIPGPSYNISTCNSMGPGSPFTSYFIDNDTGSTITYEGFTRVLQAFHAVIPCNTYHLKMVIADGGNYIYDSGVFIRGGSLQANTFQVQAIAGNNKVAADAFAVKGCAPGKFRIRRPQVKPVADTVRLIIRGTAVNGVDYAPIADSVVIAAGQQEADVLIRGLVTPAMGIKSIHLLVKSPLNCSASPIADSAVLLLRDTITINILTPDTVLCKGETAQLRVDGDTQFTYRWTPQGGLSISGERDPLATPLSSVTYKVTASWPEYGCPAKQDSVRLTVLPVPVVVAQRERVCLHQSLQLGVTVLPPYTGYIYSWSGAGGFTATGPNPVLTNALRKDSGYDHIMVGLDTSRCVVRDSFLVSVEAPDTPKTEPVIFCQGKPAMPLTAKGSDLRWYAAPEGGTGTPTPPVPPTTAIGTTSYYVTQTSFGCESERGLLPVEIKVCCDMPVFIPTAFTPNNDSHNDTFSPRYPGFGNNTGRLRIFNRWGQMVFESFDSNARWNGTWNNRECPGDTYYYELIVHCKDGGDQQFTGDVLLIR